jgi:hydroxymethylpyrimidine pyrophosphatase-like HAD family hydrolase
MKFSVLALDYDGTIAVGGVLDSDVRIAIGEARAHGIAVILVTGRILSELRRVAGDLGFVDAVVAENGAVLTFPNGLSRSLGHPLPAVFLDELRRRGIEFAAGQCVVETDATSAPRILAVIRELELPLVLVFNRGRLMVLPQAISKGTGLHKALTALRLSVHNAIAIGDAENDHDLLTVCEHAVAVGWGSQALQKIADEILHGNGPSAVAAYVRSAERKIRLPPDRKGRHRVNLGTTGDGHPLALVIRGRNALVVGDPRSGKSWATGLYCEQLILDGYCVCVIDPEGDYGTLASLPGVMLFGGDHQPPRLDDLVRGLQHPDMSVVVDLSHVPYNEKVDYLYSLLPMLARLRRTTGLPHRIVVDEAHYFLHKPDAGRLLDLDLGAYTLVTYRLFDLHPDVRKAIETVVVTRTTDPDEVRAVVAMLGKGNNESEWKPILEGLATNEAVLLPGIEEAGGKLRQFKLLPRLTSHVHHRSKYLDVPMIEDHSFVFTDDGNPVGAPARTLKEFVSSLANCPPKVLDGHARRGDFSRWIADVVHDRSLALVIRKVEQRYRLGYIHDIHEALTRPIQTRYEITSEVSGQLSLIRGGNAPVAGSAKQN